ncbi:MAG TPA: alkaline phosphatase family protein, partial [Thermoanaerobaculia bacterium]|nr:alkaline phosphatase family protein [Thermoanaerobaculia bacterium]
MGASAAARAPQGRLVVLGFDGADARTAQAMMDRGELPHLARLREQGTFAPLGTTVPAESPVSWASLNSGQNPAKTGIAGFVVRSLPAGGDPGPKVGFYESVNRETSSLQLSPLLRFLVSFEPKIAGLLAGISALAVFALLFVLLLRIRKSVALPLALALGAAGGWAGFVASASVPRKIPGVVANLARTGGFWEEAARAGVPSVVLDGAMTWDRPEVPGAKVLSGLGVPDVRGAYGDWFVYTTDASESDRAPQGRSTSTGGTVFRVDEVGGRIDSMIYGPRKFDAPEAERLTVSIVVERTSNGKSKVTIDGADHEVGEGEWSPWYRLSFDMSALVKVHAITRVKVLSSTPFALYLDFLQIDPSSPPFWQPVSQPVGFSRELARATSSPFETVGWACLTMPLKDKEIEPRTFLEDIDATRAGREKLFAEEIAKSSWRLFMAVESTPDRVQHMMYQFYDREHPKYVAAAAQAKVRFGGEEIALADAIPAAYRQIDRLVGEVMDKDLRPGDTLIECSDHGFQSFRRGINLNNWLFEHGYLVLTELSSRQQGSFLQFVDWSRTRAYAVGLGMIFLNLRGRETGGIVESADAPALLASLERDLLATRDGDHKVLHDVYRMDHIHSGPYLDLEGDLMVGCEAGYRVGWSTTTGGIRLEASNDGLGWKPTPSIEDNTNNWSGDHVSVARDLVPGI